MSYDFLDTLATPSIAAAQAANGSREFWSAEADRAFNRFTPAEAEFISRRDSFYMASVAENGWPYIQHRGGPAGFLRVLDETTLGFADFRGNRQYISLGNLTANDKVALFLMDYPNRSRMKLLGHAEFRDIKQDITLRERLLLPGYRALPERAILFHLTAFDWNCPQHITPRFTEAELAPALAPIRERLLALEAENAELQARLQN